MPLVLYAHPGSQPSRAVMMYLTLLDQKYELKQIDFMNGENRTEEFAKINPNKLIPVIEEDGFFLSESAAILTYLAQTRKDTKYYPQDPKDIARVNMFLHWHHSNTRPGVDLYFVVAYKKVFPLKNITATVEEATKKLEETSKKFEDIFLKNTKFVAGDQLTIADLLVFTEYQQVWITTGYDFKNKFPKIFDWMERIMSVPELKGFNKPVEEFAQKYKDLMNTSL